jgi:hypothetical protein
MNFRQLDSSYLVPCGSLRIRTSSLSVTSTMSFRCCGVRTFRSAGGFAY